MASTNSREPWPPSSATASTSAARLTASSNENGLTVLHDAGPIEAEYAVLAVPGTVVRKLRLDPPLRGPKAEAVAGLRYNNVLKVHLQFRRRFWRDDGGAVGIMSDLPIQTAWDSTYAQDGERGILSVYAADWGAEALAAMPESERFAFCVEQLERIYPGRGAHFERGASVVWRDEPENGGAYSYFAPGG